MLHLLTALSLICPRPIPLPFQMKQMDSLYYIEKVNSKTNWGHNEYFTGTSFTPDDRFTLRLKDTCVLKTLFFKTYVDPKDWKVTVNKRSNAVLIK